MKPALLLLTATLALASCRDDVAEIPDPVPMTEEAVSYFCQMDVLEHGGPKAQIHLEGQPAPIFFAQVRDAIAYLKSPERDARVMITYVSDMGSAVSWKVPGAENWIDAQSAFFVIGAGVAGGMGAPEIVPFARTEDAENFVRRYGGRPATLSEIPQDAAIGPVDPAQELETPS
jgi:copper chaperone NosL